MPVKSRNTIKTEKPLTVEKYAYRPREFQCAFGVAKSYFYDQVAKGRLKIIKAGKATLVTREAVTEWLALCESETPVKHRKKGA